MQAVVRLSAAVHCGQPPWQLQLSFIAMQAGTHCFEVFQGFLELPEHEICIAASVVALRDQHWPAEKQIPAIT